MAMDGLGVDVASECCDRYHWLPVETRLQCASDRVRIGARHHREGGYG